MSKPTLMKKSLILLLFVSATAIGQDMTEISIYFDKNSDMPEESELAILTEFTEQSNANQHRYHVTGFTDKTGSKAYNKKLAKGRTNSVVHSLLTSGVEPQNILFDYEGNIIDDGSEDESSLAKNRRVDVTVFNVGNIAEDGFAGMYDESLFNRPIPTAERQVQTFTVNASEESQITTSTGTIINIPPKAFMDAFGRPIEGDVQVDYEEYNDPFSIFLSGITMKVDENGVQQNLESAGMFNITASQDDRPIELRPGSNIDMEFVSTNAEDDFTFYFLDQNDGEWNDIGEAALSENVEEPAQQSDYSQAVVEYLTRTAFLSQSKAERMTLDEKFWDMDYIQGQTIENAFAFTVSADLRGTKKFEKAWENKTGVRTKLLPKRKRKDGGGIYFKVETGYWDNKEWGRFYGTVWEYDGTKDRKELKEILGRKRYQNLRLLYDKKTNEVAIALKNLDTIYQIPVKKITMRSSTLDYMDRKNQDYTSAYYERELERMNRDFEIKYRTYEKSLNRQEKKLTRSADREDRSNERSYKRSMKRAYKTARGFMNDRERAMDLEDWQVYCSSKAHLVENDKLRQVKAQHVVRSLVIDRMGIYNCDRLMKRLDLQSVTPEFALADGTTIDHVSTYVFENGTNGVIAYGKEKIKFNPRKLKMILLVDRQGKTYQLNGSEIFAMNKNRRIQKQMHVTEFNHEPSSLDQMKDMLSLAYN